MGICWGSTKSLALVFFIDIFILRGKKRPPQIVLTRVKLLYTIHCASRRCERNRTNLNFVSEYKDFQNERVDGFFEQLKKNREVPQFSGGACESSKSWLHRNSWDITDIEFLWEGLLHVKPNFGWIVLELTLSCGFDKYFWYGQVPLGELPG